MEGVKEGKADENEKIQLMRELMGRLERLEEFKNKMKKHLSGGDRVEKIVRDAQMPPAEVYSALGQMLGPGIHIAPLGR